MLRRQPQKAGRPERVKQMNYRKLTREFLLGEARQVSPQSYFQTITELLDMMNPRTASNKRRLESIRESVRNLRRHMLQMEKRIIVLQEQIQVLEEAKKK